MRTLQLGVFTLVACLLTANWTEANGLFRRCRTCQTGGSSGARNVEAAQSKAENIQVPPAPAALTTPLAISKSGLESEVLKRAADWTSIGKGVTPTGTSTVGETKTVIVTIGDQTFEITIRAVVSGKGEPIPPTDLAKSLQAAFNADDVLTDFDKGTVKNNLAKAYAELAAKLRSNDLMQGTEKITKKEGVHRVLKRLLLDNAGGNLTKTQNEIDRLVVNALALKNDMTMLTPEIRADLATQFERVAAALKAVK